MKFMLCITILFSLSPAIAMAMKEAPIDMEAATPQPDLTPPEALEIIKILNNPDKYEQPDHIAIIGDHGSGKTTLGARIIKDIDASYRRHHMHKLLRYYQRFTDEKELKNNVILSLINPTIETAIKEGKSKAVLLLENFHMLYINQHKKPFKYLLNALNPSNYVDLRPPLLLINVSLPFSNNPKLPPIEGANIIRVQPPNLIARKQLIQYWVEQNNYVCDEASQFALAEITKGKSIATIAVFLADEVHRNTRKLDNVQKQHQSSLHNNPVDIAIIPESQTTQPTIQQPEPPSCAPQSASAQSQEITRPIEVTSGNCCTIV
jgi:hypothetical protein